jgi:hypothetical protein
MNESWFETKIHMTGLSDNLIRLNPVIMIQQGTLPGMLSVESAMPGALPPDTVFGRKIGLVASVAVANVPALKVIGLRAIYKNNGGSKTDAANYDFVLWQEVINVPGAATANYSVNNDYMRVIQVRPIVSTFTNQEFNNNAILVGLSETGVGITGISTACQTNYTNFDNPYFSVPDGHLFQLNDITVNTSRSIEVMVFKKPILYGVGNGAEWKCIYKNTQNNGSFLNNSTHFIGETVYPREEVLVLCRTFAVAVGYGSVSLSGQLSVI